MLPPAPAAALTEPTARVASLRLLDLRPGMNVLEVGCGIGYSTALLARLVGPEGRVTGVDLDARAVARAREVHRRLGLATQIITGDGYDGLAEAGPFDRIVAYTGLADVSTAWFEQLSPQGFILAPIDHCVDTPYFRIEPDGAGACVMWAGFKPARGRLGWTNSQPSPWRKGHAPDPGSPLVADEAWQIDSRGFWLYLTFRERRLARLLDYSLMGERSYVSWNSTRVRAFGEPSEANRLLAQVKALAAEFERIGEPAPTSVRVRFEKAPSTGETLRIRRLYHYETAELVDRGESNEGMPT